MNQQTHRKQQSDAVARSAVTGARAPRTDHLQGRGLQDPLLSRSAKASADDDKDDDEPARLHRSARAAGGGGVAGAWGRATAGAAGAVPYRREMERAFGQDFSGVRAYTGRREPMEAIGAHAAANGEQVAFAEASPSRKLVAHELTHVVQRRRAGGSGGVRGSMKLSQPGDAAEQEAERVSESVVGGRTAEVSALGGIGAGISRKVSSKWQEMRKPASGKITGRFGEDRGDHKHSGTDFACDPGSSVKSALDGQVIQTQGTSSSGGYGNRMVVKHSNTWQTTYNHLSSFEKSVGERVRAGAKIAESGNTGNSTGPHLHFEVVKNGKYVNPESYIGDKIKIRVWNVW